MSLDLAKLEKVREQAGGIVQARCPACAEGGHDRAGEHLRIFPDGRFGCCVAPKDKEHRRRIFALAGGKMPGTFTLRVKTPPAMTAARSVKAALTAFAVGTPGTLESESGNGVPSVPSPPVDNLGTLGTGNFQLRACARGDNPVTGDKGDKNIEKLKDWESAVPSVPSFVAALPPMAAGERLPFLTADGTLSIPFDSPERYHWWKGGESVTATLREVKERMKHATAV